jgi:dephospho-CoA kinase
MIILGLTGSIGMGKSTAAKMFAQAGAPVFDADETVHRLYAPGGAAAAAVGEAFPGSLGPDGGVDRKALSALLKKEAGGFARLEAIVHPLVARERKRFLDQARRRGVEVAVLDIPLLFETGGERAVDLVAVVSAPPEIQRERVLSRPGMTEESFKAILARQVPDSDKRARADFVIDTSGSFSRTRLQIAGILRSLKRRAQRRGRSAGRRSAA